jgi:hypothetical protein
MAGSCCARPIAAVVTTASATPALQLAIHAPRFIDITPVTKSRRIAQELQVPARESLGFWRFALRIAVVPALRGCSSPAIALSSGLLEGGLIHAPRVPRDAREFRNGKRRPDFGVPGGSFGQVSGDGEGLNIARELNAFGIPAFVLCPGTIRIQSVDMGAAIVRRASCENLSKEPMI